ncbi:MAG: DGQHR domain-containing protein [Nitrospirae bacterium]|nr:DGQHR domain-containing protein [Nitrospirota bacterium]
MEKRYYLPALRGRFGDWAYYSALMPLNKIAERIDYAKNIPGEGNQLSKLIQRELKQGRAMEIASYICENDDRFFNSLVIAVYGGKPQWHPFDVKPVAPSIIDIDDLDSTARDSIGYLSLTNEEKLFALDGQHRLAGIKEALAKNPELGKEELSIIFVAHETTEVGLRRTRKLFTTLNKQAKPVNKSEIIALDESDAVAIVTRRLVEYHEYFNDGQIDILATKANLPHGDIKHFTTIINLYDMLDTVLLYAVKRFSSKKATAYRSNRPDESELEELIETAASFFEICAKLFPELGSFFKAHKSDRHKILSEVRSATSGHILFRPIGLLMFCQIFDALMKMKKNTLNDSIEILSLLPTNLNEAPYKGTLWDPKSQTIDNKKMAICRDILLYMLDYQDKNAEKIRIKYAKALGEDEANVQLPKKLRTPTK